MLDIKVIRTETERVKKALARRKENVDIDAVIALDENRRELLFSVESLKAKQNEVTKQIPMLKKEGKDTTEVFAEMKKLSDEIKELDVKVREAEDALYKMLLTIPNIPNDTVPDGDSDEDNVEIRRFGEPTQFPFEAKPHWELGEKLDILDFAMAGKITGAT